MFYKNKHVNSVLDFDWSLVKSMDQCVKYDFFGLKFPGHKHATILLIGVFLKFSIKWYNLLCIGFAYLSLVLFLGFCYYETAAS